MAGFVKTSPTKPWEVDIPKEEESVRIRGRARPDGAGVTVPCGLSRSEESVVDNLLTFLFAGQDSTAAAMASCLCYLCANPTCKDHGHWGEKKRRPQNGSPALATGS